MAGLGPLLAQHPELAQDPTFLQYLGDGQSSGYTTQTQAQAPGYSTTNNPTLTDPQSVTGDPNQVLSTAPLPIQDFGNYASVAPTYANAAYANPNQNLGYIQQYENLTNQGLQPQFQQQQQQLQEQLAARGISNTGAAGYLEGNLLGQQGATLAGAYAPLVQQGYGYSQADIAANQANQQSANQYNASTANQAAGANASSYNNAVQQNYNAYNAYLNTLLGYGANEQNSLLSAYLNSFGANTGVTNAMGQGLAGVDSTFGNVYSSALGDQGAALGSAFGAVGNYAGAGGKF